jgi:hypothetical protein
MSDERQATSHQPQATSHQQTTDGHELRSARWVREMGAPSKLRLGGDFLSPDSTALRDNDDLLSVVGAAFAIFAVEFFSPFRVQLLLKRPLRKRKAYDPKQKAQRPSPSLNPKATSNKPPATSE